MGNPLTILLTKLRFLLSLVYFLLRYVSYFMYRKNHLSGRVHKGTEQYSTEQYSAVLTEPLVQKDH